MYWRVRKVTPDMLFKQYGLHLFLAISLLVNVGINYRSQFTFF